MCAFAVCCGSDPEMRASDGSVGSSVGMPTSDASATEPDDGSSGDADESTDTETDDPTEIRHAELAGHSLVGHPLFDVVQDFNDDESIELAIDPTRWVGTEGRECDAWIVASRDLAGWASDPALVDVRGAPQAVAIGDTLASSRFEIAAPGAVSSAAGSSFGVAYDVVLDCNRNAMLDGGDVIDGGAAPGLWRTHDATATGPLAVSQFEAYASQYLDQRTFYPTDIAAMGQLPLVVVTHGWSYNHTYYDYIGEHLASYGYIVMFHEAEVLDGDGAGTIAAANTTLDNLEDLLANQAILGDGVLDGHIDARRIMLTGHSTGGEAVVRALTQLRDGWTSPSSSFGYADIRVVSSMAPVSWHPRGMVDPGDVPYHMFVAGADADVSGAPEQSYTQCRSIFERAVGPRQLTYIHGAGHGDLLSCCGELFIDQDAPALIGRAETNRVARSYFLGLAELYLRDNAAARELFTRSYADFHPPGIASSVVVTNEYRSARAGAVVLDDFEDSEALDVASSGGAVTFDVANAAEVLLRDNDGSLAWTGMQPSNGMTHARHDGDSTHALVFDWSPGKAWFYEHAVTGAMRDFAAHDFISLRATQGTRHPETVALAGDLSFTITLRDVDGTTSSIPLGERDVVPPPYARAGFGAGTGWQNEFVTIRVRLDDFRVGSEIDLSRIAAVRLEFGESFGSARGRLGIDDLELVDE
jgi:dienelactone hydrolase